MTTLQGIPPGRSSRIVSFVRLEWSSLCCRHRYHENLLPEDVPWPWLSGSEWEKDLVVRCGGEPRRVDLAGCARTRLLSP